MIVVGCGKSKLAVPAKARDLYVGSLFRAAKHYASRTGESWVILSAAHGVIDPDTWLRPYNERLELRGAELTRWARLAADEVARRRGPEAAPVQILAGVTYAAPLARELALQGIESVQPLEGLALGFRLRKLYSMWDEVNERAARPSGT